MEDKADWGAASAGESAWAALPKTLPRAPPRGPLPCWACAWALAWAWAWAAPVDAPGPDADNAADADPACPCPGTCCACVAPDPDPADPDDAPVDSCSGKACCDRLLCLLRRPKLGILVCDGGVSCTSFTGDDWGRGRRWKRGFASALMVMDSSDAIL